MDLENRAMSHDNVTSVLNATVIGISTGKCW
jgi:hypothetical protein